jgi:hypothetical protein
VAISMAISSSPSLILALFLFYFSPHFSQSVSFACTFMEDVYPYATTETARIVLYITENELQDFRPTILDNALLLFVDPASRGFNLSNFI